MWPVVMASYSMVGLRRGSMAKGGMDLIQNLVFDLGVVLLCIANAEPDLMRLGVVNDAIVRSIA